MTVLRIVFQKNRSKRRLDKRAGTQNNKQIEFWQNKLSTEGFNTSKDLNPELRIQYMSYYGIYTSSILHMNALTKSNEKR